jgi:hypothetical protein
MAHELSVVQKAQIVDEWRRRVIAEYNSAAVTNSLVGWLIGLGASPCCSTKACASSTTS